MLRERRIEEIARGRDAREIPTPELNEILRLYGVPIPRFETAEVELAWEESEEAEAVLSCAIEEWGVANCDDVRWP